MHGKFFSIKLVKHSNKVLTEKNHNGSFKKSFNQILFLTFDLQ